MQKQIAALYARLSQEDRNKLSRDDESESIINQQNILTDYCKRNGFEIYDIYKDEDFSGSDRERPEFNRMISDARKKRFNTIICKTQSRFARDMELIEKYVNGLFPIWGIRFISVVDNGDTMNRANRKTNDKKTAVALAVAESFPTVITSGAIMSAAGLIIAFRVSDVYVGHIGFAVGRGALISVILVLTVLPVLIMLFDKAIEKTTIRK